MLLMYRNLPLILFSNKSSSDSKNDTNENTSTCVVWVLVVRQETPMICHVGWYHHSDVIMSAMTSQTSGVSVIYSIVCSGENQRNHQSSASLPFVRGIHRPPVNSLHKGPVTWKTFPFDYVIMKDEEGAWEIYATGMQGFGSWYHIQRNHSFMALVIAMKTHRCVFFGPSLSDKTSLSHPVLIQTRVAVWYQQANFFNWSLLKYVALQICHSSNARAYIVTCVTPCTVLDLF